MSAARINPIEPERWLEFARDDLAYGESGMADHPRPAALSFQQAGEKSLKTVFLHRGLNPNAEVEREAGFARNFTKR